MTAPLMGVLRYAAAPIYPKSFIVFVTLTPLVDRIDARRLTVVRHQV